MWFKLATADFTDKNLGTMADIASSWGVSYTTQGGISKNNCPTIVKMNDNKTQAAADFTATFTLADGATLTSITATLKSSGAQLIQVTSGNSITIPAASITGDIVITAIASGSSSGGGGSEGDDSTTYTITYVCKDSSGTTLKTTTETGVVAGTSKTFTTSGAPAISGYTCTSVSPTSATINQDTTVTYTYTAVNVSNYNFANAEWSYNQYINNTSGKLASGAASGQSGHGTYTACLTFVPVVGGTTYKLTLGGTTKKSRFWAWYTDSNQDSYISGEGTAAESYTAPANAKYVRISLMAPYFYTAGEQVVDGNKKLTSPDASTIELVPVS